MTPPYAGEDARDAGSARCGRSRIRGPRFSIDSRRASLGGDYNMDSAIQDFPANSKDCFAAPRTDWLPLVPVNSAAISQLTEI